MDKYELLYLHTSVLENPPRNKLRNPGEFYCYIYLCSGAFDRLFLNSIVKDQPTSKRKGYEKNDKLHVNMKVIVSHLLRQKKPRPMRRRQEHSRYKVFCEKIVEFLLFSLSKK